MTIEEKRKEIKEILLANGSIENLTKFIDERFILSSKYLPSQNNTVEWGSKNLSNTMLVVNFDETIRCYQIILFKLTGFAEDFSRLDADIMEISELYYFSSGPTLIRLLENESDTPLIIGYSHTKANERDFFCSRVGP